jgi:hypothetical protein
MIEYKILYRVEDSRRRSRMDRRMDGWRDGRMGGFRDGFSSLLKQNKKAKICAVFYITGKRKLLFYIYTGIVKQKIYKLSSNYYSPETQLWTPELASMTQFFRTLFKFLPPLRRTLGAPPRGRLLVYSDD